MVISAEQQEKIVRVAPKRKTKTPVFEKAFLTPLREFGQSISGSIQARKSKLREGSTSGIENESYASTESISQASKSSKTETRTRKNSHGLIMSHESGPINKFTGTLDLPTPKKGTPVKRPLTLQLSQPEEETAEDDSQDTNRTPESHIRLPISNLSGSKRSFETQFRFSKISDFSALTCSHKSFLRNFLVAEIDDSSKISISRNIRFAENLDLSIKTIRRNSRFLELVDSPKISICKDFLSKNSIFFILIDF